MADVEKEPIVNADRKSTYSKSGGEQPRIKRIGRKNGVVSRYMQEALARKP